MSSTVSIATPTRPDLAQRARRIGVDAHLRRQVERDRQPGLPGVEQLAGSARSSPRAVPKPAYCRMVHSRPRYIVGWTPRVNGNCPGSPRSRRVVDRRVVGPVDRRRRECRTARALVGLASWRVGGVSGELLSRHVARRQPARSAQSLDVAAACLAARCPASSARASISSPSRLRPCCRCRAACAGAARRARRRGCAACRRIAAPPACSTMNASGFASYSSRSLPVGDSARSPDSRRRRRRGGCGGSRRRASRRSARSSASASPSRPR